MPGDSGTRATASPRLTAVADPDKDRDRPENRTAGSLSSTLRRNTRLQGTYLELSYEFVSQFDWPAASTLRQSNCTARIDGVEVELFPIRTAFRWRHCV